MKSNEPKMLTVREVAELLNVGQSSVRLWAKEGRLLGAKLEQSPAGAYWLIPITALETFSKQKPGPKPKRKKKRRQEE
jgi:excisionase family DNA binding protein